MLMKFKKIGKFCTLNKVHFVYNDVCLVKWNDRWR